MVRGKGMGGGGVWLGVSKRSKLEPKPGKMMFKGKSKTHAKKTMKKSCK